MSFLQHLGQVIVSLSRRVARAEIFVCQLLIVGFSGLLLVNVTLRYLLSSPLYFAEELAVYILIWMAFLAIAATIQRREMIALTFIADSGGPRVRLALKLLVDLIVLAMVATLTWVSVTWLLSPAVRYEPALTLGTLKRPFYAIVPLFFALATLHTLANLIIHLGFARQARKITLSETT